MKGNNGLGDNPERDDWETPEVILNPLIKQYGLNFDCCANKNNFKFDSWSENFLSVKPNDCLGMVCWMNPPFSNCKVMFEQFFRVVNKGLAIYRCDNMETKVWQEIILPHASWVFIPKGRVSYYYNPLLRNNKGTRFPSAIIGFNVEEINCFEGVTLRLGYGK